jgi:hypothetical protein
MLDFLNLVINIKFSIEFEQNIVNINLLEHVVRQNIITIIVETSSHFKTKAFFFQFFNFQNGQLLNLDF